MSSRTAWASSLTAVIVPPHNVVMPILAVIGSPELTEGQLVERFRETGESRHFETLYLRTRRTVYSRCLAIVKDGESAEDLSHETFLRAYDQFARLEGSNFSGWVYKIATNLSLNWLRDKLNRQRLLRKKGAPTEEKLESTEERLLQQNRLGRARRVLKTLKEEQRTVLTLKYVEGCSYSEIEAQTGYTYDQVRSYLQNARRNFQIRWAEQAKPRGVSQ